MGEKFIIKRSMNSLLSQKSVFSKIAGLEYFRFEDDFMENNIRCVPMIVRFKMDTAGIKLKLSEWNRFSTEEKTGLALRPVEGGARDAYHRHVVNLIKNYTGKTATPLPVDPEPEWSRLDCIPFMLSQKASEFDWNISSSQWKKLTDLQRFALLKLCRPGHENANFPKAMKEFNLIHQNELH